MQHQGPMGSVPFFGLFLDLRRREKLCSDIAAMLARPREGNKQICFRHYYLNAIKLPQAIHNPELFAALKRADCLSADGMGIVLAGRAMGIPIAERVTGIDLMTALLPRFAADGVSVFLLGARPEIVEKLRTRLTVRYPELVIAGSHHGFEPDDAKLAGIVRKSGADAVFVALPSPRKELFIDRFGDQTGCRFAMGVGGAFDVLAGEVKRAPVSWQRMGIEFLWRTLAQPRYMIPRYGKGLWRYLWMVGPEIFRFQSGRLRNAVRKVAIFGLLLPLVFFGAEGKADITFDDIPGLQDQAAMQTWLENQLLQLEAPEDITRLIDALVAAVLAEDTSAVPTDVDWQQAESALQALLGLVNQLMVQGTSGSFLLETLLDGVMGQLLGLHPQPQRVASIATSSAPDLAMRVLVNQPVWHELGAPQAPSAQTPDNGVSPTEQIQPPVAVWANRQFPALLIETLDTEARTELWDNLSDEAMDPIAALEDASPR